MEVDTEKISHIARYLFGQQQWYHKWTFVETFEYRWYRDGYATFLNVVKTD